MLMHDDSSMTDSHRGDAALSRQLGLATATALVVAEVIGVGIFLTTAGMAKSLGSPFWLLVVWLIDRRRARRGARSASGPWRRGSRRPAGRTST